MITESFEGFSHSLRILAEALFRSRDLLFVDAHESAGNIERGLTDVLNACHSLYDSAEASVSFDWYGTPQTATILAIRNARHHNLAHRIRGLYTYHLQQRVPEICRSYVIVDYLQTEDGGVVPVPISWHDLHELLELPRAQSRLQSSVSRSIFDYLGGDEMNSYAPTHDVPARSVFLNITPLIVNAAIKFVPS